MVWEDLVAFWKSSEQYSGYFVICVDSPLVN